MPGGRHSTDRGGRDQRGRIASRSAERSRPCKRTTGDGAMALHCMHGSAVVVRPKRERERERGPGTTREEEFPRANRRALLHYLRRLARSLLHCVLLIPRALCMCVCLCAVVLHCLFVPVVGRRRKPAPAAAAGLQPGAGRCRCRCLEISFFWVSCLAAAFDWYVAGALPGRTRTGRRARSGGRASRIGTVSQPCAALIKKRVHSD